jgi:hypothetical protein
VIRNSKGKISKTELVLEYIIRNPFSLEKIRCIEESGSVIYRSGMSHGKSKKNFQIFNAEEFIATITQHIPDKSFQLVRYYGWHSNHSRGDQRKQGLLKQEDKAGSDTGAIEVLSLSKPKQRKIPI